MSINFLTCIYEPDTICWWSGRCLTGFIRKIKLKKLKNLEYVWILGLRTQIKTEDVCQPHFRFARGLELLPHFNTYARAHMNTIVGSHIWLECLKLKRETMESTRKVKIAFVVPIFRKKYYKCRQILWYVK